MDKLINFFKQNWIGGVIGAIVVFWILYTPGVVEFITKIEENLWNPNKPIIIATIGFFTGAFIQSKLRK